MAKYDSNKDDKVDSHKSDNVQIRFKTKDPAEIVAINEELMSSNFVMDTCEDGEETLAESDVFRCLTSSSS
ncbi:hypothetical protein KIN20_022912 [Parelaphostrongylus tenuis]|uniref:Uncharacterized protein n=1 Tax=Parelaphostrongylus tenuis TaxID=148309 RepID=A0AAD5QX28_PARTN|nr:hypothetical protein KIN20_022912 [Parelaphostrongylus tenuis]